MILFKNILFFLLFRFHVYFNSRGCVLNVSVTSNIYDMLSTMCVFLDLSVHSSIFPFPFSPSSLLLPFFSPSPSSILLFPLLTLFLSPRSRALSSILLLLPLSLLNSPFPPFLFSSSVSLFPFPFPFPSPFLFFSLLLSFHSSHPSFLQRGNRGSW